MSDEAAMRQLDATMRRQEDQIKRLNHERDELAQALTEANRAVEKIAQERDEARAALQWRPIETAPRDETQILWRNQDNVAVIRWPEYELCFYEGEWMPIPGSPDPTNG